MNPILLTLVGLLAGISFGLLTAWGNVTLLVAGIGVAVLLAGMFFAPKMLKPLFGVATLGFLLAWVIGGGLSVL